MSKNDRIKVLIVDDYHVIQKGLKAYVEVNNGVEIVGELNNGDTLLSLCEQLKPEVILMDIVMPGLDGLTLTRTVRENFPGIRIIVITGFQASLFVRAALEAGATGYLPKDASPETIIHAIRAAKMGFATLSEDALNSVIEQADRNDSAAPERYALRLVSELRNAFLQADHNREAALRNQVVASDDALKQDAVRVVALTFRESQIVKLVLMGFTSEEIATCLCRSPRTVQKHRANLMRKLGARNQIELTRIAYQLGIMPSEAEGERIVAEANKALGRQN